MAGRRFLAGFAAGLALFVAAGSGSTAPGSESSATLAPNYGKDLGGGL
ncbi:hypothetical protein [Nocardia sp. NPDC058497]